MPLLGPDNALRAWTWSYSKPSPGQTSGEALEAYGPGEIPPFLNIQASLEVLILLTYGNPMEVTFISHSREKTGK